MSSPPPDSSIVSKIAHEVFEHQPSTMPKGRWWQYLQTNFHRRPEAFELGRADQVRVGATAAFDVGVRTTLATLMGATALPLAFNPIRLKEDLEDAPLYMDLVDRGKGRDFYPEPPLDVVFREKKPRTLHFSPKDGRCVDLSFDSQFLPYNPRLRERYLAHGKNLRGSVRYFRHDGPARPTLILVHGFLADAYLFNEYFFQVKWFYEKLGLDVAIFTLPFHGARQGNASLFSGHWFFSGGLSWIAEAFRQTVYDFRSLLNYLERERKAPAAGVSGISLGGYTTSLLASVEPRLAFAIPNVPVVSLPDLVLEWEPVGTACRSAMFAMNLSLKEIRHAMAIHCALSYEPLLPKDRLMIVGGVGDRLAPPKHARLLWDHWERPAIHWFPGNHVVHLDQGEYLRYQAKFMDRIGFLPR